MNNKLHIGTMGWSYKFWIKNFYPVNIESEDFLKEYSNHFNTVEVNNTFYRTPSISTLENWKKKVKTNFLFSLKVPRKITHDKMFKDTEYLAYFFSNLGHLGSKLGPLLLQFPPSFKPDSFDSLKDLISILPNNYRYAVEIRNRQWLGANFYTFLKENRIALVLGDSPWLQGINEITADFNYYRWEGDRKKIKGNLGKVEKDRKKDIKKWADKIQSLPNNIEIFGYFSKYFSGHPPTDVNILKSYLTNNTT